jgi:hypothetical protein
MLDKKLTNLFRNANKLSQFVRGILPISEIPDIVTEMNWDWKKHIYTPEMVCPNLYIEMFDREPTTVWGAFYNKYCGWTGLESGAHPKTHKYITASQQKVSTAEELANVAAHILPNSILFFFACRGDPDVPENNMLNRFRLAGRFGQPQTYNLPRVTQLVKNIQEGEKYAARLASKKRILNNTSLNVKRPRVNNKNNV